MDGWMDGWNYADTHYLATMKASSNDVFQVFSIVVFGCIANQGWHKDLCFNSGSLSPGVCNYGTAIGVLAFLLLLMFLALDALFDTLSNVQLRKYIVIADILCSGKFFCDASLCVIAVLVMLQNKMHTINSQL